MTGQSVIQRILFLRHGETEGESSIRYHGANDVPLSSLGRAQMARAAKCLPDQGIDRVVASPLSRAWAGARIVCPRGPILLESDFREIHFGDWEGLTAEEIERLDADAFRRWREAPRDFRFPGGEERGAFRARVARGLARLLRSPARSPLVVAHHGVIRSMVEQLCGEPAPEGAPTLGGLLQVTRDPHAGWRLRVLSAPETP